MTTNQEKQIIKFLNKLIKNKAEFPDLALQNSKVTKNNIDNYLSILKININSMFLYKDKIFRLLRTEYSDNEDLLIVMAGTFQMITDIWKITSSVEIGYKIQQTYMFNDTEKITFWSAYCADNYTKTIDPEIYNYPDIIKYLIAPFTANNIITNEFVLNFFKEVLKNSCTVSALFNNSAIYNNIKHELFQEASKTHSIDKMIQITPYYIRHIITYYTSEEMYNFIKKNIDYIGIYSLLDTYYNKNKTPSIKIIKLIFLKYVERYGNFVEKEESISTTIPLYSDKYITDSVFKFLDEMLYCFKLSPSMYHLFENYIDIAKVIKYDIQMPLHNKVAFKYKNKLHLDNLTKKNIEYINKHTTKSIKLR